MRTGVAFLDTNLTPPWNAIVEMFNKLDQDMIDEVNSFYDEKKIIKSVPSTERKPNIDQKVAFDISQPRMAALNTSGMIEKFPELATITEYFCQAEEVTTSALACLASSMMGSLNTNFRLVDYQAGSGSCQPHRDFGLLTLIEGSGVSGLEVEVEDKLVPVPAHTSILLAGWCLHLVSNGRVPAPLHRVASPPARRQAAVTFLAPAKETVLEPLVVRGEAGPVYRSVGVGELKEMMAKRWRVREGTLTPDNEEVETSQDEFVFKQLKI